MMNVQKIVMKKFLDGVNPLFTRTFLPWLIRHPRYLRAGLRLTHSFKKAERIRDKQRSMGVRIPPVLILSVISTCNLFCLGCYASASLSNNQNSSSGQNQPRNGLDFEKWRSIIDSARNLGVFGFIIAGGEPFLYPKILDLCMQFKDIFFLFVTNGTSLAKSDFEKLKNASNIGVIVSLEGNPETHDARRGAGVYVKAYKTIQRLGRLEVITGVSATITRENYTYWMNASNIESLIKEGVSIEGVRYHDAAMILNRNYNIMVRSGQHCVHSWFAANDLEGSIRVSFYLYNTIDEIETLLEAIRTITKLG